MSKRMSNITRAALALVATLFLAACAGQQATPTVQPSAAPTAPPKLQATSAPQTVADGRMVCTVVNSQPTAGPTETSIFPPVTDEDWRQGPDTASITLVEYSDFQCPYCSKLEEVLKLVREEFGDQVQVVFRHYPLIGTPEQPFHEKAALAGQAAEAAGRQGKFWEMHEALFSRQAEWAELSLEDFTAWLSARAVDLALDADRFSQDLNDPALAAKMQAAWEWGQQTGLPGTPFVLLNGRIWPSDLPISLDNIKMVVKLQLVEERQFYQCPPMVIATDRRYVATLHTAKGDIVLELFADKAPLAVNNFVFLAQQGWYTNSPFHRVLPGFMAQGGDPTGTGFAGPGYAFANELNPDLKFDRAGLLAMANAGADTNGSQFFITYGPAPHLDGGFTIFGQVLSGQDVLESLTPRDPSQGGNLPEGDLLLSVEIEEK